MTRRSTTTAPSAPSAQDQAAPGSPAPLLRPGRPTSARAEAITAAILNAGREHFLSLGFDATPMEAIAAAAGISKGTLYARYPTKDALLQAVVADRVEAWQDAADLRNGPLPADFKQRLNYIARSILGSMASEEIVAFQRVLTSSTDAGGELARALHEAGHNNAIALLTRTIIEGTQNYPAPLRDPAVVAEMMMAMLTGWYDTHRRVRTITQEEAMAYAEHVVDVVFFGRTAW